MLQIIQIENTEMLGTMTRSSWLAMNLPLDSQVLLSRVPVEIQAEPMCERVSVRLRRPGLAT